MALIPIRASRRQWVVIEIPGWPRRILIAALTFCFCFAVAAQLPDDRCPEKCGEVLKNCLEESANRYKCIDVAERCLMECRGSIKTGASDRFINLSTARRHCASGS